MRISFWPGMLLLLLPTVILVSTALLYAQKKLAAPLNGRPVRISVIQGNIDQARKWDRAYADAIMQIYMDLSRTALKDQPDLIVWPETATPGAVNKKRRLNAQVRSLVKELSVPILLGSAQHRKLGEQGKVLEDFRNSAYLFPPDTKRISYQRYDKIRLFTFGEYLPYADTIPWEAFGVRRSMVMCQETHIMYLNFRNSNLVRLFVGRISSRVWSESLLTTEPSLLSISPTRPGSKKQPPPTSLYP